MSERFTVKKQGKDWGAIKDKYHKYPMDNKSMELELANSLADWLNENIKDYPRFELRTYTSRDGHQAYMLWDNETDDYIRFRPICNTNNPNEELNKYIDWLNSLVEREDEN